VPSEPDDPGFVFVSERPALQTYCLQDDLSRGTLQVGSSITKRCDLPKFRGLPQPGGVLVVARKTMKLDSDRWDVSGEEDLAAHSSQAWK
jgi:hypothetical protein